MQIKSVSPAITLFAVPLALALAPTLSAVVKPSQAAAAPVSTTELNQARTWGYQLQNIRPDRIVNTDLDVVVIDYSSDGTAEGIFSRATIDNLKHKPDGSRRIVLAYLSVGEAEDYRFYWDAAWSDVPPDWLMPENPEWPGNFPVRYWDSDWQNLIFATPGSYIDHIIGAGFDGVYLDRVDAFDLPDRNLTLDERKRWMVKLVTALAQHARAFDPDFLIIPQNGEELLTDPVYVATINGLGKEDLFFGVDGDGIRNHASDIRASLNLISNLTRAGKPVFLVEYLTRRDDIIMTRIDADKLGMPLFIGSRPLDQIQSR